MTKKYFNYILGFILAFVAGREILQRGFKAFILWYLKIILLVLPIIIYAAVFTLVLQYAFGIKEFLEPRLKKQYGALPRVSLAYHILIFPFCALAFFLPLMVLLEKEQAQYVLNFGQPEYSIFLNPFTWYAIIACAILLIFSSKLFGPVRKTALPIIVSSLGAWLVATAYIAVYMQIVQRFLQQG